VAVGLTCSLRGTANKLPSQRAKSRLYHTHIPTHTHGDTSTCYPPKPHTHTVYRAYILVVVVVIGKHKRYGKHFYRHLIKLKYPRTKIGQNAALLRFLTPRQ